MNTKVLLTGLATGVTLFFAGFLIYGLAMADYFMTVTTDFPGLFKPAAEIGWIAAGNLIWGFLLSWLLNAANVSTVGRGAGFAALALSLYSIGSSLVSYGQMNLFSLEFVAVEAICMGILGAAGGAVAGLMLGRSPKA